VRSFFCWLVLSVCLLPPAFSQTCENGRSSIIYTNGIANSEDYALDSLAVLAREMESNLSPEITRACLDFRLTYNDRFVASDGKIVSVASTIAQLTESAAQRGVDLLGNFWTYWYGLTGVQVPDWFAEVQRTAIFAATSVYQPDLVAHEALYSALLGRGDRVIVVAHSQGNLYANQAYFTVTALGNADRFRVVAVATPAAIVAGGGSNVTLRGDIITLVPFSLGSSVENSTPVICPESALNIEALSAALKCHSFVDSYLAGDRTLPRIVESVQDFLSAVPVGECSLAYRDEFDGTGPLGSTWAQVGGNLGGVITDALVRKDGKLTTSNTDGLAGIFQPMDTSVATTVSFRLSEKSSADGAIGSYGTWLLFQSNGNVARSGTGVVFRRTNNAVADSSIELVSGGNFAGQVVKVPFEYGSSIDVSILFEPDGRVRGSLVNDDGREYSFSFTVGLPQTPNGTSFQLAQELAGGQYQFPKHPTIDSLKISTGSGCIPEATKVVFRATGVIDAVTDDLQLLQSVLPRLPAVGEQFVIEVTVPQNAADIQKIRSYGQYAGTVSALVGSNARFDTRTGGLTVISNPEAGTSDSISGGSISAQASSTVEMFFLLSAGLGTDVFDSESLPTVFPPAASFQTNIMRFDVISQDRRRSGSIAARVVALTRVEQ
jgi:hypothetical protein